MNSASTVRDFAPAHATDDADAPVTRRPFRVLRIGDAVSVRIRVRSAVVCAALLAAVVAVGLYTLATGDYSIPVPDVVRALLGGGDQATHFVVDSLRAPRLVTGVLVGAALGASGAVFQSITRNPLGSPDVIGFGTGSACGAVAVIVLAHGDAPEVSAGALAGGLATAAAVYLLALRGGAMQGFRLILVGIGVTGMLTAFDQWMLTRASINDAVTAQIWLTGSLNGRGWAQAVPLAIAVAVLLPCTALLSRQADLLEMGDDAARALGLRVERGRLALVVLAVALVAVATAAAGPVTFVALAAPQIARRMTKSPGVGVGPAAAMGALVVPVSDLAAQRLFPSELPVGVATGAVGGVYLAFLLARQWRGGR
ncbi:iron chelate uptake ABC transporter family permease subunit [Streptantibioticus parmotrematis]|uniref:FecCD family ABC transporter permease n=1 Tax=Streptantibioticus parmotrematis TaxID=2873249 RepID=UPI0033EBFA52